MMKKLKSVVVLAVIILSIPATCFATTLHSQNVTVQLEDNGDALVINEFDYSDDAGTEHYMTMGNLKNMELTDYKVYKNGQPYKIVNDWDVNKSKEEKKGLAGIINNGKEQELCYGIGDYGRNKFTVSYRIKNAVQDLNDAQMLFFRFINDKLSEPPKEARIEIKANRPLDKNEVKMWGFGYEGTVLIENSKVVLKNTSPLTSQNYMTALLKFSKGVFSTSNHEDKDFQTVLDKALQGASISGTNTDEPSNNASGIASRDEAKIKAQKELDDGIKEHDNMMKVILMIVASVFGLVISIAVFTFINRKPNLRKDYHKKYADAMYKDIPYNGNIEDVFCMVSDMGIVSVQGFMSAMFLKWIKQGIIKPIEYETGLIFKKEQVGFKILTESIEKIDTNAGKMEKKLFKMFVKAAKDDILESKEFSKWLKLTENRFEFSEFEWDLYENSEKTLNKNGYLDKKKVKKYIMFVDNEQGKELCKNLLGFNNYLESYSMLNDQRINEVRVWDDYMIYAGLFGITKEVQKEFEQVYPKYSEQSSFDTQSIRWTHIYATSIVNTYRRETSSASSSSFSGGGGSSFSGGGGGSFGGGSGGGTR